MSQWNGDKSRYNRERKQNILRRKKVKELLDAAKAAGNQPSASKKPTGAASPVQAASQA